MALVDPNIMRYQQGADPMGAVQGGLQMRGLLRQDREAQGLEAFKAEFQAAAQGQDLTTEDGLRNTLKRTAQKFPQESMAVYQEWQKNAPQAAKPVPKQFHAFGDKAVTFDPGTGQAAEIPGMTKPAEPAKPKNYQMVKNRKGVMEPIDPTTGLNPQGRPVEAWIDPKEPRATGPKAPDMRGIFEIEQKLSKDFQAKAQNSINVATAYNKIDASIKQNNPLDAYNAIVQFVKIIDPGTAAREGEVQSAVLSASGGVGEKLQQAARKAYNGTLDATTAANIIASAKSLMGAEKKTFDAYKFDTKKKIASYKTRGYQLDESAILGEFDSLFDAGAPKKQVTEADIDNMTAEEFDAWEKANQ